MQDVLNNPQFEWNDFYLSMNPNITMQNVLNNPNREWKYNFLSLNPNVTIQDIFLQFKWDGFFLSQNKFTKQNQIFKERVENLAATIIQRFYLQRIYKPTHSFIQKKCLKDMEEYKFFFKV